MKKLFFLLLFIPFCFFSQKEEDYLIKHVSTFSAKNPDWKKQEAKISNAEKIKLITSLFFDDSEQYCKGDSITNPEQFLKHYASVFHFTDIDNDKDVDLIFSGMECAANEVGKVNVYVNENNSLKKISSEYGKLAQFNKNCSLIIYKHTFFGTTANTLTYLSITKDAVTLKASVLYHTYNYKAVATKMIPAKLKAGKTVILKTSALVLLAPEQNDKFIVARTKDGASAIIYSAYTDGSGAKWLYVKLNYTDVMQNDNLPKANVLGWVKSQN